MDLSNIWQAEEPGQSHDESAGRKNIHSIDDARRNEHAARVEQLARELGDESSRAQSVLARVAAQEVFVHERLADLEVLLLWRAKLLLENTEPTSALKIMRTLSEVTTLRRGGARRLEEVLRALGELQSVERAGRRQHHLRAA